MRCFWRTKEARSTSTASELHVETGGKHTLTSFLHSKFTASGASWYVLECTMCRQSRRLVD